MRCDAGTLMPGDRIKYDIDLDVRVGTVRDVVVRYHGWAEITLVDDDTDDVRVFVVPAQHTHELLEDKQ